MTPIEKVKEIAKKFEILESIDTMDIQVACNTMYKWAKAQMSRKFIKWYKANHIYTSDTIKKLKKAMEEQL